MGRGTWQAEERELRTAADTLTKRLATAAMGDWFAEFLPWTLFLNPLTFDPFDIAGAGAGELTNRGAQVVEPKLPAVERTANCGQPDVPFRQGLPLPRISEQTAMRRFQYFLDRANATVGVSTQGVIALERHKSGQPHGHGLLWLSGGVTQDQFRRLHNLWFNFPGNGYMRMEKPRSPLHSARYCAKYMTKEVGEMVFSKWLGRELPSS